MKRGALPCGQGSQHRPPPYRLVCTVQQSLQDEYCHSGVVKADGRPGYCSSRKRAACQWCDAVWVGLQRPCGPRLPWLQSALGGAALPGWPCSGSCVSSKLCRPAHMRLGAGTNREFAVACSMLACTGVHTCQMCGTCAVCMCACVTAPCPLQADLDRVSASARALRCTSATGPCAPLCLGGCGPGGRACSVQ